MFIAFKTNYKLKIKRLKTRNVVKNLLLKYLIIIKLINYVVFNIIQRIQKLSLITLARR